MSRNTPYIMSTIAVALATTIAGPAASAAAPKHGPVRAPAHRVSPVRPTVARTASLPVGTQRPTREVLLSVGQGELVTLPSNVANVWTSNPGVADVYVSNPRQIHLFGKDFGEATVFATTASGQVVYSTNVRVSQNITSVDRMLKLAMPDANITTTTAGQLTVLTGTVASPDDAASAEQLVKAVLNPGLDASNPATPLKMQVISRLRSATPLQVNLHVRIAEVSRSLSKQIGVNLLTRDGSSGFQFGIAQGRDGAVTTGTNGAFNGFKNNGTGTTLGAFGRLFGLDIGTAFDLAETNGLATLLAEPNLTALSGETASFLAGGEFPIPISQGLGAVTVEYKQYGVSLAFTPTVLADGRISMRVRPEVSQLSDAGSVRLNGFTVPAITTRRTETTVELGSGQSFMISGLLQNNNSNSVDKAPGLGDVPVLGALFRSNGYRRNQTELMIVVTPYLVKPVDATRIALPTDGLQNPTDLQTFLLGQDFTGKSGAQRPKPRMVPPTTVPASPSLGTGTSAALDALPTRDRSARDRAARGRRASGGGAAPGFSN